MVNSVSGKQKPICPSNTKKLINFAIPYDYVPVTDFASVCELYINLDTESLPDLNKYPNLKILSISGTPSNTKMVDLPASLWNLRKLQRISFTYINFKDITLSGIEKLSELKELQIHETNLKEIPTSIGKLTNLINLDLSSNGLSVLPQDISNLQSLTTLNLPNNNLTSLSEALGKLKKLKSINLQNNQFTTIPAVLTTITSLEEINLNHNKISLIPTEIGKMKNLKKIYLSNWPTYSKYCGGAVCRRDIEYFINTGNTISDIPDSMSQLLLLRELDITNNPISAETKNKIKKLLPLTEVNIDPPMPIDRYDR